MLLSWLMVYIYIYIYHLYNLFDLPRKVKERGSEGGEGADIKLIPQIEKENFNQTTMKTLHFSYCNKPEKRRINNHLWYIR